MPESLWHGSAATTWRKYNNKRSLWIATTHHSKISSTTLFLSFSLTAYKYKKYEILLIWLWCLLPPAYVVRREGTVFTGVCLSTGGGGGYPVRYPPGGYPGPGTTPGGYPDTPPRGVCGPPREGTQTPGVPRPGYSPPGGTQTWVPPGGYPGPPPGGPMSGYPPGGVPGHPPGGVPGPRGGYPGPGTPPGGGTRVGQQKEYSLHGGRYASCVHAGGLSCLCFVVTIS